MSNDFNMADAVISRLARQISDLVVQLAVKDAEIEQLNARLQVQQAGSETG